MVRTGSSDESTLVVLPSCMCTHVPRLVALLLKSLVPAKLSNALWVVPDEELSEAMAYWNGLVRVQHVMAV